MIAELDEAARCGDGDAFARGQMVEGGLELLARHDVDVRNEPVDEHAAPSVEAHERDLREPVDFGERVRQREQRRVEVRRDAERVGERGERARGHPAGRRAPSADSRRQTKIWKRLGVKVNQRHDMTSKDTRRHALLESRGRIA